MKLFNSRFSGIVLIAVLFLLAQIIMGLMAFFMAGSIEKVDARSMMVSMLVCDILLAMVLVALRLVRRNPFVQKFSCPAGAYVLAIVAIISLAVAEDAIFYVTGIDNAEEMKQLFGEMAGSLLGFLVLCIIGPLVEELVFREGIQRHLMRAGMRPWMAIVLTALIFAIVHGNLSQGIAAMMSGCLLGFLFLLSGNIRLSLSAHVANNTAAFLMLSFFPDETELFGSITTAIAGGIMGLIFCGASVWWMVHMVRRRVAEEIEKENTENV